MTAQSGFWNRQEQDDFRDAAVDPSGLDPTGFEPDGPTATVPEADGFDRASETAVEAPGTSEAVMLPEPGGWTDLLTGTDGPRTWERIFASENARWRRYRRPVTVAVIELRGFEIGAGWLGADSCLQFFARIARELASHVRSSDHIARIGPSRFGLLLVESDEVAAINFIHRLRAAADKQFGTGCGFELRTGWASPTAGEDLARAFSRAEERLADDRFSTSA